MPAVERAIVTQWHKRSFQPCLALAKRQGRAFALNLSAQHVRVSLSSDWQTKRSLGCFPETFAEGFLRCCIQPNRQLRFMILCISYKLLNQLASAKSKWPFCSGQGYTICILNILNAGMIVVGLTMAKRKRWMIFCCEGHCRTSFLLVVLLCVKGQPRVLKTRGCF